VRVDHPDVGGSFGIKVHVYADEMATAALSGDAAPAVKFVATGSSPSSPTSTRASTRREFVWLAPNQEKYWRSSSTISRRSAPTRLYPRTSGIEGNQVVNLTGGRVPAPEVRAKMHVLFTNRTSPASTAPSAIRSRCAHRRLVDLAAQETRMDAADFRRKT